MRPEGHMPDDVIRERLRRLAWKEDIAVFFSRLVLLLLLVWILFGLVFGLTPMSDDSMSPRISAGDLMLYYRLDRGFASDDVVVFEKDGQQYTGRIVARGGETVEITDDAQLKVNGSLVLDNDIFYTTPKYDDYVEYPVELAQDEYFVLCDYREGARDSRYFGPVRQSEIKGTVITVIRRSGL